MARIQLLLADEGNRRAMASLLSELHSPVVEETLESVDLSLVGEESFPRYREAIIEYKRAQDPVYCPVVLVRREASPVSVTLSDIQTSEPPLAVNDVVSAPVEKQALFRTISNHLVRREQTEELTADLRERNDRLREERTKYRTLVERSQNGIAVVQNGAFAFVNGRMEEITGRDSDALREMPPLELFTSEQRAFISDQYGRLIAGEIAQTRAEVPIRTPEGRKQIDLRASRISYDGAPAVLALFQDISRRKEREQDLRRFKNAVEHAGHAILITDDEGTIQYVNPAFEEMTGYTAAEAIGEDPSILKSGAHGDEFYTELWETILSGEVWNSETVNERKSGERLVLNQTIAPIKAEDGVVQGFVAIQDDITDHRLRQQQLAVFDRVLRHNLRNKGAAIQGYADVLQRTLDEDRVLDHLGAIQDNVGSLLEMGEKARHARQAFNRTLEEDSNRELTEILERLGDGIASSYPDTEVVVDGGPSPSPAVDTRVMPALRELIENAAKHCDAPSPQVFISARLDGTTATVTVVDNGSGLPSEEQRVIEAGTEDPLEHGSGLGLWFAYWLITYVGGTIDITADHDGTEIRVTVPTRE
jgi:PAS domain S-box-containing protein